MLLTDGRNTRGIEPLDAVPHAVERRVRVYTIGFGTTNPSQRACTRAQLGGRVFEGGGAGFGGGGAGGFGGGGFLVADAPTLMAVAEQTGGSFHAAEDADQLREVFAELPREVATQRQAHGDHVDARGARRSPRRGGRRSLDALEPLPLARERALKGREEARSRSAPGRTTTRSRSAATSIALTASAPTSSRSSKAISPSRRCDQPPTTRPSHQTVGPALPFPSKSTEACGPRYQSRSFQPIVVGSRVGSSAAHGSGGMVEAEIVGERDAGRMTSRSTSTWGSAASAARASRAVQPVHQRMSVSVAGPNARSQRAGARTARPRDRSARVRCRASARSVPKRTGR